MSVLGQQASINRFLSTEYVTIGQNVKLQIGSRVKSQSSSLGNVDRLNPSGRVERHYEFSYHSEFVVIV